VQLIWNRKLQASKLKAQNASLFTSASYTKWNKSNDIKIPEAEGIMTVWGLFVPGRFVPRLFVPFSYKVIGIKYLASEKYQQSSFYLSNVHVIYTAST